MKKLTFKLFIFMAMIAMIGCSSDGIKGIEIAQNPTKLTYNIGEELNLEGIVVKVIMIDGNKYILDSDQFAVSGYDKTMVGNQTIMITYGKHKQTFTIAVVDYNGPVFTGMTASSTIQDMMPVGLPSEGEQISNKIVKALTAINDVYITSKNTQEYLLIHINQPEGDQYEMLSVTINTKTYQIGAKEFPTDINSRTVSINLDGTIIYVPVTMPNEIGEQIYTVDAIKYVDGTEIKDVQKEEGSQDWIVLGVGYRPITRDLNKHSVGGIFDPIKREIIFSYVHNIDSVPIKEIWINGEQVPTSEPFMLQRGWVYKIPVEFELKYEDFARVKLVYDIYPGLQEFIEFFVTGEDGSFNIYDGKEFIEFIDTPFAIQFNIKNDIIIPVEFTGFTKTISVAFYNSSNSDTRLNISYAGTDLILFDYGVVNHYSMTFYSNSIEFGNPVIIRNLQSNNDIQISIIASSLVLNETIFIYGNHYISILN